MFKKLLISESVKIILECIRREKGRLTRISNTCNIRIARNDGRYLDGFATGEGPIDAAYNAINDALKIDIKLLDYMIESVTGGTDAQGAVSVKVLYRERTVKGYGVDINIFEASIAAYLNAINTIENDPNGTIIGT